MKTIWHYACTCGKKFTAELGKGKVMPCFCGLEVTPHEKSRVISTINEADKLYGPFTELHDYHTPEEIAKVRELNKQCLLWTCLDGEGRDLWLDNGYHFVNRMHYMVATKPYPEGVELTVKY